MKVKRILTLAILAATLISLISATLLHETLATHRDSPQQIPVGAAKNEQNMTMTITPRADLTDTDIKVLRMHIDEATMP